MKIYHKSNLGSANQWGTSHPDDDIEFDTAYAPTEFRNKYGVEWDVFGRFIPLDGMVVGERLAEIDGGLVLVGQNDDGEIEVWTGTAIQDLEGYYYEAEISAS